MRCWIRKIRSWLGRRWRRLTLGTTCLVGCALAVLAWATHRDLLPLPEQLPPHGAQIQQWRHVDRTGQVLSRTFQNHWNVHDVVPLHDIPLQLQSAFIAAEDRRFYDHQGGDHRARLAAVWQNLRARRAVRGASTLSEQSVRMLHPRSRTLWSRWLEGWEARRLEECFSKAEILQFYLNQVPYGRQRRGVAQAARLYFDRDLSTLDLAETLTLAVLVRSPSGLDPWRRPEAARPAVLRLAVYLMAIGELSVAQWQDLKDRPLRLRDSELTVDASHFLRFVESQARQEAELAEQNATLQSNRRRIRTTLDASLQGQAQDLLRRQIQNLASRGAQSAAAIVIDHQRDEILAWAQGSLAEDADGHAIDKVLAPRQPGSTLKPFLYAMAMEQGWTAATHIDDTPLQQAVGNGLHSFHNYSRAFYGSVRLRDALGNSLNIPAIRALRHVGHGAFLQRLHALGFDSLGHDADLYGDGLALGTGEVTLLHLAEAYAALARGGLWRPLRHSFDAFPQQASRRLFDPEISSIIAHILADDGARELEFGAHSVLSLPHPTAVKTGTSNDYRDAWAVGFNGQHTVAVWMGHLDRLPMHEVTGSRGPGWVLRHLFAALARQQAPSPPHLHRQLQRQAICAHSGAVAGASCPRLDEWFRQGHDPEAACSLHSMDGAQRVAAQRMVAERVTQKVVAVSVPRLVQPTADLHLARDPRIPDRQERFLFKLQNVPGAATVHWWVDGRQVATTSGEAPHAWPLEAGRHVVQAQIEQGENPPARTPQVTFYVR